MPENEANAAGSSAADSQAQRATTNADPTPAASSSGAASSASEIRDPEAKARADAEAQQRIISKLEARVKEFEKRDADAELAKLGDLEKVNKQLEQVTAQAAAYKATIASLATQLEASKLGIIDPETAAMLIQSKLDLGDDGRPTNAGDLLSALLKEKTWLKAPEGTTQQQPPRAGMSATNAGRGSGAGPTMADFKAGKISVEQSKRMWADGTMAKLLAEEAARNANR